MAIMSMGVKQGAEVTVTCEGADEDAKKRSYGEILQRKSVRVTAVRETDRVILKSIMKEAWPETVVLLF